MQLTIGEESVWRAYRPGNETACRDGTSRKKVLAPRHDAKASSMGATRKEVGADARAGSIRVAGPG